MESSKGFYLIFAKNESELGIGINFCYSMEEDDMQFTISLLWWSAGFGFKF